MWSQVHAQFWLQWLKKYKSLRCLWDVDSKEYNNRAKRNDAYIELIRMAQRVNKNADELYVRKRISCFRSSFRRQLKMAKEAKEKGVEYVPSTYYFDLLKSFVRFNDNDDKDNSDNDDSDVSKDCSALRDDNDYQLHSTHQGSENFNDNKQLKRARQASVPPFKRKCYSVNSQRTKIKHKVNTDFQHDPIDEYSLLGKQLAAHFRNMNPEQRLLAERLISDVCVFARMGKLSLESDLVIDTSKNPRYKPPESKHNVKCLDDEIALLPEAYMETL